MKKTTIALSFLLSQYIVDGQIAIASQRRVSPTDRFTKPSHAKQHRRTLRTTRVLEEEGSMSLATSMSIMAVEPEAMDMIEIEPAVEPVVDSKSAKSGESKSSKKLPNISGRYLGLDAESGNPSNLYLSCDGKNNLCDIILQPGRFSNCDEDNPNPFNGLGIAKNIPRDQLGDFKIKLYCKKQGETEIDLFGMPSTYLVGNIEFLSDGIIRRNGPSIVYYKDVNPVVKDMISPKKNKMKNLASKTSSVSPPLIGQYIGADTEDGSGQLLTLLCREDDKLCDIDLFDVSFSTCKDINDLEFFGGVGVARDIPQDSLDDFEIRLYCLEENELEVDINDLSRAPDAMLTGNLVSNQEGIIHRTGPGFTYYLRSNTADSVVVSESSSVISTNRLLGVDTEDGSTQALDLVCENDLCNVTLTDSSFSTCIQETGLPYFGGLARAINVPQEDLDNDNFELDLYCLSSPNQPEIDFNAEPTTKLVGNFEVLGKGIVKRTKTGFVYSSELYVDDAQVKGAISNGQYQGTNTLFGSNEVLGIYCSDDNLCDVDLYSAVWRECINFQDPLGPRFFLNGVGAARNVLKDSLIEGFDINIYCIPNGVGVVVDIKSDQPSFTVKGDLVNLSPAGVIERTPDFLYFKSSPGE